MRCAPHLRLKEFLSTKMDATFDFDLMAPTPPSQDPDDVLPPVVELGFVVDANRGFDRPEGSAPSWAAGALYWGIHVTVDDGAVVAHVTGEPPVTVETDPSNGCRVVFSVKMPRVEIMCATARTTSSSGRSRPSSRRVRCTDLCPSHAHAWPPST